MAIEELLGQLTLEEKCSLLSGSAFWYTQAVENLGIRRLMLTDGPHGLRKQVENADHLGLNKSVPALFLIRSIFFPKFRIALNVYGFNAFEVNIWMFHI